MKMNIVKCTEELASERPVFHSEADFQFALAWAIRERYRHIGVRLEHPTPWSSPRGAIDIWLRDPKGAMAIELKYWKEDLHREVNGEQFDIRKGSALLVNRYAFWKDVARIEALTSAGHTRSGCVIALTNANNYWNPGRGNNKDIAFHLYEGREVSGTLDWAKGTGAGTMKGKEEPITLHNTYTIHWRDYSSLSQIKNDPGEYGKFRYLLLAVPPK